MAGWELIAGYSYPEVKRMVVPGGWLYDMRHVNPITVFVPEPRTAEYEEGYKDGFNDKARQGEKVPALEPIEARDIANAIAEAKAARKLLGGTITPKGEDMLALRLDNILVLLEGTAPDDWNRTLDVADKLADALYDAFSSYITPDDLSLPRADLRQVVVERLEDDEMARMHDAIWKRREEEGK
jgi:hypothetical protein